ncbi:MAG: hypothetical protein ACI4OZ_09290, partial [Akkermansia sp.]
PASPRADARGTGAAVGKGRAAEPRAAVVNGGDERAAAVLPVHRDFAKYANSEAGTIAMVAGDGERGYVVRYFSDEADAEAGISIGEVMMTPQEFGEKLENGELMLADVLRTDNQGNPLNEDGSLKLEKVSSVDELTDEDFNAPSRNVELPELPENVDAAIGAHGKPVVIKKNIFARNLERHSDLTADESRSILASALYTPDLYGQNQKAKRPYNWVVINTKEKDGRNRLVLLEVNGNKENVEIVHWHYIDERGLNKIKRQAEREGGQLLILPSNEEEAGALSSRTQGLSSAANVVRNFVNPKVAGGENAGSSGETGTLRFSGSANDGGSSESGDVPYTIVATTYTNK